MRPRYEVILRANHGADHPAARLDPHRGGAETRTPLRLAVAQPLCVPLDVAANARAHAAAVRAAGARVVVFPELSLTGYELDAPVVSVDDPRLAPLVEACADSGTLALAGAPIAGDHIAVLAVTGAGVTVAYRKMWLGDAEARRFRPGDVPVVLDVDGWRVGLAVCRDTGVAAHAQRTAALGIDVYAAGVLESARDAAVTDQRVRRIVTAHGVWVAVASFAGSTGGGFTEAAGRSGVWTPQGEVVGRAGTEPGESVSVRLG
ncbi:carbon-nitrogen hydrolase family protein [Micromonospora sp. LAH09]|uniref:carbon-nitrogen hydrolase family protein n=1 Tax=Micromonospora cabrerizensis TaxID=2911213 RepID=UPI001EE786D3|nr:carbon-nitrogen hydrolase family protein [Micromonospora cabrerizensis]MCG5472511.1 carbon-nitrogen hydrolase family protein [Micromonospora cabrerizensis]